MNFTDKYMRLPIKVFDQKSKDLTGKEELADSVIRINPMNIESYRPSMDDENAVVVITKSGDNFAVYLSLEVFEKELNDFNKAFTN